MTRRIAVAAATFAAGVLSAVHHHPDRPTLPAPATAAPDAPPRTSHPSRSRWRHPLTVPRQHHNPRARHGRRLLLTVTAYCATGNRNAAGDWPSLGTAAANAYPLGTRLRVASVGEVVVADRSAPGATDVDIYLGDGPACTTAAAAFGRQQLLVEELTR